MNKFYLISFFLIACHSYLGISSNENTMKENSIIENQSCMNIESIVVLKKYMTNSKNAFSTSSFGPPLPVKIYYTPLIENINLGHFNFYNENKKIEREEIHITNTMNDTLTDFSYCITLKNNKIKLEYGSSESNLTYTELDIKYHNHFCELIRKINKK